ncbi:MAG: 2-oxoacid:ferredoxin oxidoreductase subunit beta, partial [Chakrabartia godavariana]
ATPCAFALGAGARFVARTYDVAKQTVDVLKAAHAHKGASFVEIFQNCIVYNADVFGGFTEKANQNHQLWLENGKPMLFAGGTKGITMDMKSLSLQVVDVVDGNWEAAGVIVHDVTNRAVAHMLVEMPFGAFPMALGVLYDDPRPTFDSAVIAQNEAVAAGKTPDLQKLISTGQTWTVDA